MKIEAELLEKVKAATGPDKVLDASIELELDAKSFWKNPNEDSPPFTASVDAALALVERVLPGWQYLMGSCNEDGHPWACVTDKDNPYKDYAGTAPTIPFALIEALLLAKNAQP